MATKITERARALRLNATEVEKSLWLRLRQDQLGVRFRRQYVIGNYVVDFACPAHRFVIELDGGQHNEPSAYDDTRTDSIHEQGYDILRFWNTDLAENLDGVVETIFARLQTSLLSFSKEEGIT